MLFGHGISTQLRGLPTRSPLSNFEPSFTGSDRAKSLAYAALYRVLVALFQPGSPRLEPFETNESDITPAYCYLTTLPSLDSIDVRVQISWLDGGGRRLWAATRTARAPSLQCFESAVDPYV